MFFEQNILKKNLLGKTSFENLTNNTTIHIKHHNLAKICIYIPFFLTIITYVLSIIWTPRKKLRLQGELSKISILTLIEHKLHTLVITTHIVHQFSLSIYKLVLRVELFVIKIRSMHAVIVAFQSSLDFPCKCY